MANEKLTKRAVDRLEPREKDYIVFDEDLPGFGVRVMPSGKRFYLIQYRRHGRTRRVMIGPHGPVTAEIARREANRMLGAVRGGGDDPATLLDIERQAATIPELGARFLKEHVEVRCKPSTQYEYRRAVELFINPFFGKQRVRTVTSADAAELRGKYANTPYQSNRVLGVLSKMMNLAEVWGMRDRRTNPCDDVRPFPERKRERFLSPEEIERLGAAPTGRGPTASSEAYPHRRNPTTTIPRSIFGPSQRSSRPPARSSRILTSLSGKRSSPSARTSAFGRRICTPSSPAFPRRSQHRRHERKRFGCPKTFGISATGSHTTNRSSGGNSRMTIRAYGF